MDPSRHMLTTQNQKLKKVTKSNTIKRDPIGKAFHLKFPASVNPKVVEEFRDRKVELISRKRFVQNITRDPKEIFVGTLRVH